MRVLDSYREDMETMDELNEYRGGNRKANKTERQKVLTKLGKDSNESEGQDRRNDKE